MSGICYNCFQKKSSYGPCPSCGYDLSADEGKYPLALKAGSILSGCYTVGRVLGQGGFGITYIAQEYSSKECVAIKEYLPTDFAGRDRGSNSVQVYSSERKEYFEYGKEQFLLEAKTLAEFIGDEHVVRIHRYFEENSTAYFEMEYVDGLPLDKYIAQKGGRLSVGEAGLLLLPLMDSLGRVHEKGIIHRDIAPDNIIIEKSGSAKLIDFGAARYSTGEKSKSLDVVIKHGFAPMEQYARHGRQGAYTDVYAMAATFYYAITGRIPQDSIDRIVEDNLVAPTTMGIPLNGQTEEALFKALEVSYRDRYQKMSEFHRELQTAISGELEETLRERERREREAREAAERAEQERKEREAREREEKERKEREAREADERRKQEAHAETERQEKAREVRETQAVEKPVDMADVESSHRKRTQKIEVLRFIAIAAVMIAAVAIGFYLAEVWRNPKPGSTVYFGAYEQDNNLENGKEPIEWIVLDVQDNRALLISKYALDYQQYNLSGPSVSWEDCSLREWLNDAFIDAAFSSEEQAKISTVMINSSQDQIFLLDISSANQFFSNDTERQCKPTAYAKALVSSDKGNCNWWLQTHKVSSQLFFISTTGIIKATTSSYDGYGRYAVRPAMWIKCGT